MDVDAAQDVCAVAGLREVEDYTLPLGQLTTSTRNIQLRPSFKVSATPNPFKDQLVIELETKSRELAIVQLIDKTGREIQHFTLNGNIQTTLNLSGLPSGLYLLKVFQEGSFITRKVLKQ